MHSWAIECLATMNKREMKEVRGFCGPLCANCSENRFRVNNTLLSVELQKVQWTPSGSWHAQGRSGPLRPSFCWPASRSRDSRSPQSFGAGTLGSRLNWALRRPRALKSWWYKPTHNLKKNVKSWNKCKRSEIISSWPFWCFVRHNESKAHYVLLKFFWCETFKHSQNRKKNSTNVQAIMKVPYY